MFKSNRRKTDGFEKIRDFTILKKNLSFSAKLVVSALRTTCGSSANSNVADTANRADGSRTTNVASNANTKAAKAK